MRCGDANPDKSGVSRACRRAGCVNNYTRFGPACTLAIVLRTRVVHQAVISLFECDENCVHLVWSGQFVDSLRTAELSPDDYDLSCC